MERITTKLQAYDRLQEIMKELDVLGTEAMDIFKEFWPSFAETGRAYGAFSLGSSGNEYDTTLESLIESIQDEDEDEE